MKKVSRIVARLILPLAVFLFLAWDARAEIRALIDVMTIQTTPH